MHSLKNKFLTLTGDLNWKNLKNF